MRACYFQDFPLEAKVQYIISNLGISPSISFYFYLNKLKNYLGQIAGFSTVDLLSYKKMKRLIYNFSEPPGLVYSFQDV